MNDPNELVTATYLAGVLGVTPRRLRQLANDGVLPKARDGKMPLAEMVQRYFDWKLKAEVARRAGYSVREDLERAQLQRELMRNMREARQLCDRREVEEFVDGLLNRVVAELVAVPARLSRDRDVRRQAEEVIFDLRKRLADHFKTQARALREGAVDDEEVDDDGA